MVNSSVTTSRPASPTTLLTTAWTRSSRRETTLAGCCSSSPMTLACSCTLREEVCTIQLPPLPTMLRRLPLQPRPLLRLGGNATPSSGPHTASGACWPSPRLHHLASRDKGTIGSHTRPAQQAAVQALKRALACFQRNSQRLRWTQGSSHGLYHG